MKTNKTNSYRTEIERRMFSYSHHIPERRSNVERRKASTSVEHVISPWNDNPCTEVYYKTRSVEQHVKNLPAAA